MKNLRAGAVLDSTQATIAEAAFPVPFAQGLEYGTPARGTWNIVHTGMLIPQAHQIFVCAAGCLLCFAPDGAAAVFLGKKVQEDGTAVLLNLMFWKIG